MLFLPSISILILIKFDEVTELPSQVVFRSVIVLLLKLLASGLGFGLYFYIAKQLSITEFGLFSLAMTCLLFSAAFAKQGFEQAIVKYTALLVKQKTGVSLERSFYRYIIVYSSVCSAIVLTVLLLLSESVVTVIFNQRKLIYLLPYVALLTVTQTWLTVNSSYLKGKGFSSLSMLFTGVVTLSICLVLCLLMKPDTALATIKLYTVSGALACLISFVITLIKYSKIKPLNDVPWKGNRNFLALSRSLFVISLAALLTQQLAVLILARYVSLEDVGIYSLALKISLLISYPLVAINVVTSPLYARYFANNEFRQLKNLARSNQKVLLLLATLLVVVEVIVIDSIALFFGEDYLGIVPVVKILIIGQWFNVSTGSAVSILIMAGYEKVQRRITLIITAIYVILLLLVVPTYELYGAAWVTTITVSIKNLVSFYFSNKLILQRC